MFLLLDAGYGELQLSPNITTTPLELSVCASINSCPYLETNPVLYTSDTLATSSLGASHLTNRISFVLEPDVLLPENFYRFKLTMTDRQGRIGFSEVDIKTESLPSAGKLESNPLVGVPLHTLFTFRALGWTDKVGDGPFFYRFGFRYVCDDIDRSHVDNSALKCVEWLSGLSKDSSLSSLLPSAPNSLEAELLVQVMDRNGAIRELAHNFDTIIETEPSAVVTDGLDVAAISGLFAGVEAALVAQVNWTEALAQLTSVLWSIHIDHKAIICNESQTVLSPAFKLTNQDIVNIKRTGLRLLTDLFYSLVPTTRTHHQVILSLLEKVTNINCDNASNGGSKFNETDMQRLLSMLESIVDSAVRFSKYGVISRRGLTRNDVAITLSIYEHLIDLRQRPFRSDYISESLTRILPRLSYGVCTWQSILEDPIFINLDGFLNFKSSRANLPQDYTAIGYIDRNSHTSIPVRVSFDDQLLLHYLQWPCVGTESEMCTGMCLSSSQIELDILWQGHEFSSLHKTVLLHMSLLHPLSGIPLDIQNSSQITFTFPLLVSYSDISNLVCVSWEETSLSWVEKQCQTDINILSSNVICRCQGLESDFYSVVERCPDGHYGESCNLSKPLKYQLRYYDWSSTIAF